MNMEKTSSDTVAPRVILWVTPRSLSTIFEKCLTAVEGIRIYHEPYTCAHVYGPDKPKEFQELEDNEHAQRRAKWYKQIKTDAEAKAVNNEDNWLDESVFTYQWVKDELERPHPESKIVFVKDLARGIRDRYNKLPVGYRHTFLIRNPVKVFLSQKKAMANLSARARGLTPEQAKNFTINLTELPDSFFPPKYDFGEIYDLIKYLNKHGEHNPIIIDADDIQTNPSSILRQYCKAVDIPFTQNLLKWQPGDAALKKWITARLSLATVADSYFETLLSSSYFKPLSETKAPPQYEDLPDDVKQLVDVTQKWYDELYQMRLKP